MSLASNVGFIDNDKVDLADKLHLLCGHLKVNDKLAKNARTRQV